MKKPKKCVHKHCIRPADPEDNTRGFCNKCIQLHTQECNFCQLKNPPIPKDVGTDWEDVWDTCKGIIGIILCFIVLSCWTLLLVNNGVTNNVVPVNQSINGSSYECVPATSSMHWQWDFGFHAQHWLTYLLVFIAVTIIAIIVWGFIFGYIPICGCGKI